MDLDGLLVFANTPSQRTIIRNLSCYFNVQSLGTRTIINMRNSLCWLKKQSIGIGLPRLTSAAIAVTILASFCLSGCGGGDARPASARANVAPVVPVSVATAERRDMPYYLTGLGSVTAYYTVSVKSRVDGELMQVNFKEGQTVQKGELLAVIDPRPYQVALDQAQATLFKDQAALRDAKLNYERYKQLLEDSGAMSQQQVDTQRATMNQFEGATRN